MYSNIKQTIQLQKDILCGIRHKMGLKYFLPLFDEKHRIAS